MGLAATVSREVARRSASSDREGAASLVQTLARIYWLVSAMIALSMFALAPWIATHWVQAKGLSAETVRSAAELIGVVIAARWPIGLYQGILVGKQQLIKTSAIGVVAVTISNVGGVLLLGFVSPSVTTLFAWQACTGLAQALALRYSAWAAIGPAAPGGFRLHEVKAIWRFSSSMGFVAILGVILTQTDKLLLSRLLEMSEYGKYTLAAVVSGSIYICVVPTFNALYPRFVDLIERGDDAKLASTYHLASAFLAAALFPLAGFFAVFSAELVQVWTGNHALSVAVAPIIAILAAGSTLHGLMHIPHALLLAHGATRIPVTVNLLLVCVQVPILVVLTMRFGVTGAACAWLLLHCLYCMIGTWLTHRVFLVGEGARWLFKDIGLPAAISTVGCLLAIVIVRPLSVGPAAMLCVGIAFLLLTAAASICARRDTRHAIFIRLNRVITMPTSPTATL
jgi:O-antigen/teichoic acid export membrane protein